MECVPGLERHSPQTSLDRIRSYHLRENERANPHIKTERRPRRKGDTGVSWPQIDEGIIDDEYKPRWVCTRKERSLCVVSEDDVELRVWLIDWATAARRKGRLERPTHLARVDVDRILIGNPFGSQGLRFVQGRTKETVSPWARRSWELERLGRTSLPVEWSDYPEEDEQRQRE